jgi:hypothetical protein
LDSSVLAWVGVALAMAGGLGTLVLRHPAPQAAAKS